MGEIVINRDADRVPLSKIERDKLAKVYDYYGASGVIDKVDKYIFNEELLLIGEDGANLLLRTKPIAFIANGKYWVNNHAHVLQMPNKLSIHYLCFFINATNLHKYVSGTAQPKMNQENMNSIWVSLPPLNEQHRIVSKIEELLPFIDQYDQKEQALTALNKNFPEQLKKSILQAAIQGKLTEQCPTDEPASQLIQRIQAEKERLVAEKKLKKPKVKSEIVVRDNLAYEITDGVERCIQDEVPFEIPESWAWMRLGEIIELKSGRDLTPDQYSKENVGIPYITGASNLFQGKLDINRYTNNPSTIANKGDLLITCKGTIGEMLFLEAEKAHIARQIMAISTSKILNKKYLYFYLASYIDKLKGVAKSMIPGISRTDILEILFPLPPLEEQKRIVEKIELLFESIDSRVGILAHH
ncbi:hypothetical protein A4G20_03485 [Pasteurellaceae bacterium RH1A]|nr:hypothetical protein A4G20_03485 [Pasteurellaceae bacterium RH1A]